jgi:voltage-gated potassium channel Kch
MRSVRTRWRSLAALFFFLAALVGFETGVAVTERPEIVDSGLLTKAYYSLSLFVVGGVDLGTPFGGPAIGRFLLWMSYFGAPILAASALIETLLRALAPRSWQLRRMRDHVIVFGSGELTLSYLRVLRSHDSKVPVVVVSRNSRAMDIEEFRQGFDAVVIQGDITHEFFLKQLRLEHASKIMLFGEDSLRSYEAASIMTRMVPGIGHKVVIHCGSLRFMRAMDETRVAQACQTFNSYHLAASGLVRNHLLRHFRDTRPKDVVILAGFGRFGQTILEQLQERAVDELDTVVIIDQDARRRVMVADEQMDFSGNYRRELLEGDISHPDVWEQVRQKVKLDSEDTVVVLGTGYEAQNLRTALWIRKKYPRAKVIARSAKESVFATEVGEEHDIISISIAQLVEENIPGNWMNL